jgi:hypothetical protein
VCEGRSQHLEIVNVRDEVDVPPGTHGRWPRGRPQRVLKAGTREAVAEPLEALRINATILHANLGQRGPFRQARLVQDLVRTNNFSIRSVVVLDPCNEVGTYRRSAMRPAGPGTAACVRFVHAEVLEPNGYRVDGRALWPRVLQEIITFPTLLYRFVRSGNVDALADQVGRASHGRRRRRHQV